MATNPTETPEWMTVDVTCDSEEPMLCNPMSREQLIAVAEKRVIAWPKDRPVIEQADEKVKLMRDVDGHYGFPRQWLIASLREAGRKVETGLAPRQKISTATSTQLRSLLRIVPVCMTVNADGEKFIPFSRHSDYVRDVRKGVGGNAAKPVAVAIVRPRFDDWAFKVRIMISTSMDSSRLRQCFDIAGSTQGLGDFRPGNGGEFGCFNVTSWVIYRDPADVPAFESVEESVVTASSNGKVPALV